MGDKRMREEYKNCIADLTKQKSVPQHGKEYFTVATRHNLFMKYFNDEASINTDIIPELCNEKQVAVKCTIYINYFIPWQIFSAKIVYSNLFRFCKK